MDALTVQDYRKNLAAYFDRASSGKQVLIRRKNKLYALVSLGEEKIKLTKKQETKIKALAKSIQTGINEAKDIEAGKQSTKLAIDFIDEL